MFCLLRETIYLTLPQLNDAIELLLKYEDCFVGASGKVGWTYQATHSIETGVHWPVKQPPHRTSFEEKEQIERQLFELLLEGKIQASNPPWASPVLLIKKKDGSCRFCIDYRRLNEATVIYAYLLPCIDDALDQLAEANGSRRWISRQDIGNSQ